MQFVSNKYQLIENAWKEALSDKLFKIKLLITPGLFLVYSAATQKLGTYVENRKGVLLSDKILEFIPSYDFSFLYLFAL